MCGKHGRYTEKIMQNYRNKGFFKLLDPTAAKSNLDINLAYIIEVKKVQKRR